MLCSTLLDTSAENYSTNMPQYKRTYKATPYTARSRARADLAANRAAYRAGQQAAMRQAVAPPPIGPETKFLDSELNSANISETWASLNPIGTGCTDSISVPAQGDGESERDGRVYHIKSVHIRGQVFVTPNESAAAPYSDTFVRVVLYWDTQTNGTEATATDIFDAGGTIDALAFRNLQNSKRFIVLKDKIIRVTPAHLNEGGANLFAHGGVYLPFTMNKKFKKPIKVRCTGTTANVNSVADNNLGIAAINNNAALDPSLSYQARIRFMG